MKISTKGRYALRIMIDLAQHDEGEAIPLKEISERQGITLKYMEQIMPLLSEDELAVFKRGRNAKTAHTAKNSTVADYHAATGLETLFGYLYLSGNIERVRELFNIIWGIKLD